MRKINGVPFIANLNLSSLTGGEVIKWDADNTVMAWEDQDDTGYVPAVWYGDRGVFVGGSNNITIMEYITISSPSNVTDFGDLSVGRGGHAGACSSGSRGVLGGGYNPSGDQGWNTIDYITFATTSNATDFGDLTRQRSSLSGSSDGTTGLFAGGYDSGYINIIDYVTIASTGDATDFGDRTESKNGLTACADSSRSVMAGGNGYSTTMDYVTIASPSNATDFGDLTVGRMYADACSSATRGLIGGGYTGSKSDVIDYITISTTSNATDFGNLTVAKDQTASCSNGTRGVWGGGEPNTNVIEYVTISSTGNATDFGDLSSTRTGLSAYAGD